MREYSVNVLIAIDKLLNAALGGSHEKTISQRMGLWYLVGGWRTTVATPICWALDQLHEDHCASGLKEDDHEQIRILKERRRARARP